MNPAELAKELLRLFRGGEHDRAMWFLKEHGMKISQALLDAQKEIKILTNPSDGRCMDIEAMRTRLRDANAEIERLTKSREGSIK